MLLYSSDMRDTRSPLQSPNLVIIASLVSIFLLGFAMIGTHSAVAAAAEAGCARNCDQTVLVGLAGNTLSLLAKEALGVLRIGAGTMATVTLAIAGNLGGIGLWIYAAYWAMMSHLALVVAGALLLSVVYARRGGRS